MNWVLLIVAEWRRLGLCFRQIFKEKLFLLCSLAVIASSTPKSLPFISILCFVIVRTRVDVFGDVDRLRQDIDLPVTHTLSYKPSTIFCASCGCCSHSGARYASKTIGLGFVTSYGVLGFLLPLLWFRLQRLLECWLQNQRMLR